MYMCACVCGVDVLCCVECTLIDCAMLIYDRLELVCVCGVCGLPIGIPGLPPVLS